VTEKALDVWDGITRRSRSRELECEPPVLKTTAKVVAAMTIGIVLAAGRVRIGATGQVQ
jgi:hypothetical protein